MTEQEAWETNARACGWMTEEEKHGVNDHDGVVHPQGWWQPDWQAAVEFSRTSLHFRIPRKRK